MSFVGFNTAHRGLHSHFIAQAVKHPAAAYVASLIFAKVQSQPVHVSGHNASQARMAALAMLRGTPALRASFKRQAQSLLILLQVLKTMKGLQRRSTSPAQGTGNRVPKTSTPSSSRASQSSAKFASNQQSSSKPSSWGPFGATQQPQKQKPQAHASDTPRYSQSRPAPSDEAAPAQPDSNPIADPFKVLGVKADASQAEIKKAYYKAARENHPDKGGSADAMREVNKAYKQITDQAGKTAK